MMDYDMRMKNHAISLGIKPVTQVRTGDGAGQCTEATYASILGVELSEIPDLLGPEGKRTYKQWVTVYDYLMGEFGLKILTVFIPRTPIEDVEDAFDELRVHNDWLHELPWDKPHVILGLNPGSVGHMCVGVNRRLVWDPNPRRRGLTHIDGFEFLLDTDFLLSKFRMKPADFYHPSAANINLSGQEPPPGCSVWEEE